MVSLLVKSFPFCLHLNMHEQAILSSRKCIAWQKHLLIKVLPSYGQLPFIRLLEPFRDYPHDHLSWIRSILTHNEFFAAIPARQ